MSDSATRRKIATGGFGLLFICTIFLPFSFGQTVWGTLQLIIKINPYLQQSGVSQLSSAGSMLMCILFILIVLPLAGTVIGVWRSQCRLTVLQIIAGVLLIFHIIIAIMIQKYILYFAQFGNIFQMLGDRIGISLQPQEWGAWLLLFATAALNAYLFWLKKKETS